MTEKAISKAEEIIHTHDNPFHVKTSFFDQKIKTLFSRFDLDHNGKIEKQDFIDWGQNLVQKGGISPEIIENKKKILDRIWNVYFLPADMNSDGSIDYLEFNQHVKAALRGDRDDQKRRNATNETIILLFQAIDSNEDGKISTEEFQNFFESFGIIDLNFIKDTFKIFDSNHDQFISQQEFIDVGTEYFFGLNNESTSKIFFGPLVKI